MKLQGCPLKTYKNGCITVWLINLSTTDHLVSALALDGEKSASGPGMKPRLSVCRDCSRVMELNKLFRVISGKYLRTLNNKGEFKYYRQLKIGFFLHTLKFSRIYYLWTEVLPYSLSSMLCSQRCRALTLNMATANYDVQEYPVY